MAKKLAAFLEVSLDDLLSTEELEKVAERNQIIEKPFMKYVLLILYAYISLAFLITIADLITRFSISPMNNTGYSTIQLIVVDSLGLLTQSIVFIYGFKRKSHAEESWNDYGCLFCFPMSDQWAHAKCRLGIQWFEMEYCY